MAPSTGFKIFGMLTHPRKLGFILVDTKNAFDKINHIVMLWTVCHLWPSGARFVFNCYRYWSSMTLQNWNGAVSFLHNSEGLKQGDPLYMVAYGIGILLLTKQLKAEFPDVTHPWYADDVGALSMIANVELYFNLLKIYGLGSGNLLRRG